MYKEILPPQLLEHIKALAMRFYEQLKSLLLRVESVILGAYGFKLIIQLRKDEQDGIIITTSEPLC